MLIRRSFPGITYLSCSLMHDALLLNALVWQFGTSIRRSTSNFIHAYSITGRRYQTALVQSHIVLKKKYSLEYFELLGFCFSNRKWLSCGFQSWQTFFRKQYIGNDHKRTGYFTVDAAWSCIQSVND